MNFSFNGLSSNHFDRLAGPTYYDFQKSNTGQGKGVHRISCTRYFLIYLPEKVYVFLKRFFYALTHKLQWENNASLLNHLDRHLDKHIKDNTALVKAEYQEIKRIYEKLISHTNTTSSTGSFHAKLKGMKPPKQLPQSQPQDTQPSNVKAQAEEKKKEDYFLYRDSLQKLLRDQKNRQELASVLPSKEQQPTTTSLDQSRMLFRPTFNCLIDIDEKECIQRLSNDQISELIANGTINFKEILSREDILALLIEKRNHQAMLKLLLKNPKHRFINEYSACFNQFFEGPANVKKLLSAFFIDPYSNYHTFARFNKESFTALSKTQQQLVSYSLALGLFPNAQTAGQELKLVGQYLQVLLASPNFVGIYQVLRGDVSLTDYIASKSEWAYLDLIPLAEQVLKLEVPVTRSSLIWCIEMHNKKLLNLYLEHANPQMIQQQSEIFIKALAMCEDMEIADLFYAKGLDVQEALPNLELYIKENQFQMVKWLFNKKIVVRDLELAQALFKEALASNNIEIIHLVAEHMGELFESGYPASVGLSQEVTPPVLLVLQNLALHSPLPVLYHFLMNYYPSLVPDLNKMLPSLALLVRFPAEKEKIEVSYRWRDPKIYQDNSFKYAEENQAFIQEIVTELPNLTWNAFLNKVIKNRLKRHPFLDENYKLLRRDQNNDIAGTPLTVCCDSDSTLAHIDPCRYFHAWNRSNIGQSLSNYPQSVSAEVSSFHFYYTLPSKERVIITTLDVEFASNIRGFRKLRWQHANPQVVVKCQERLEDLHKQVIQFKLTDSNQAEFYKLVAETYWLIATLCETGRGTPHNAMIWLNAVYLQHKLPPPIPKMEHFFLDNTMLMVPVEEAIARWHTFFEPTSEKF
jgi:hypothetical protein